MEQNQKDVWHNFYSKPVYDKKYMKTKVKTFNGVVYTIFWREKVPKKTYIKLKLSVMKMDKKRYPQVYLEE